MASLKSVGTACTLASVGIYLHQRGFVVGNGKRTLALISQQVTIPLLFFTKILYCNQDWSSDPCPNVVDSLADAWILLIWPVWVCVSGLTVGYWVARMSGVPDEATKKAIMVSVAFGNSTGLPITLLTVIHANFGEHSALGVVDPTLFLSVYLVMYPVLQWGIGGMMLAPPTEEEKLEQEALKAEEETEEELEKGGEAMFQRQSTGSAGLSESVRHSIDKGMQGTMRLLTETNRAFSNNVLKKTPSMSEKYKFLHRGLGSTDASLYMSIPEHLNKMGMPVHITKSSRCFPSVGNEGHFRDQNMRWTATNDTIAKLSGSLKRDEHLRWTAVNGDNHMVAKNRLSSSLTKDFKPGTTNHVKTISEIQEDDLLEATTALTSPSSSVVGPDSNRMSTETDALLPPSDDIDKSVHHEEPHCCVTFLSVIRRCLQPPVIGALLGTFRCFYVTFFFRISCPYSYVHLKFIVSLSSLLRNSNISGLFFTSIPSIREIFVDIEDRQGRAPLQWFFDGLYQVGKAAVPINMIILGCNLSASYMLIPSKDDEAEIDAESGEMKKKDEDEDDGFFPAKVNLFVVIGKMLIMPIIGFTSVFFLTKIFHPPEDIAGGLYLVLMIVFLCPTANNVMVMVELATGGEEEADDGKPSYVNTCA